MRDFDLGFDLDKLQAFYAVTQLGGVGPAARALGRSQPAISHRLRALADGLGVPLFEKIGRHLRPTPAGQELAARCADLFALTRNLHAATASSDGVVRGVVTIGTYATVTSHLLAPAIDDLLATHPELSLRFSFGLARPLVERLRSGELDIVLAAGALPPEGLTTRALGQDRLLVVTAPGLIPARVPRLRALRSLRYLAWEGDDATFAKAHAFVRENDLAATTTTVVPHLESLRRLAVRGVGWTILPHYVAADDLAAGTLVEVKLAGLDVTLDFHLLTRARSIPTPAVSAVLAAIARIHPFGRR